MKFAEALRCAVVASQGSDSLSRTNRSLDDMRPNPLDCFVGRFPSFRIMQRFPLRIGETEAPVSIEGEPGTGKAIAARAIHYGGPRRDMLFVPVNCAGIPDGLFEAEVFSTRLTISAAYRHAYVAALVRPAGRRRAGSRRGCRSTRQDARSSGNASLIPSEQCVEHCSSPRCPAKNSTRSMPSFSPNLAIQQIFM